MRVVKKSQRNRRNPAASSPKPPKAKLVHSTPDFGAALRSYLGYLEGTDKSLLTIKDYRLDLLSFDRFLRTELEVRKPSLARISPKDIERFHDWLRLQGLKSNTRRRQLLTVQSFLKYLSRRKKVPELLARKIPTPQKIERIPFTAALPQLILAVQALPTTSLLEARNRLLLWTLAETGCLVSEIPLVHADSFVGGAPGVPLTLTILGRAQRMVPISTELAQAAREFAATRGVDLGSAPLFEGFNRFGSMGAAISPRGVELLVRHYADRLGFPELTPRSFRHSAVVHWLKDGLSPQEARERLGLRSDYAFRLYVRLAGTAKSKTSATSTAETAPSES